MNIEDVRAFVAVVDMGSVGRAALRLNLTQPAISRRVQRLEEDLGLTLLDRESQPARPTRAGEAAERLGAERVVVVASRAFEIPARCRLADLAGLPWVINPDGCGFRTQLERALAASGHGLDVVAEAWGVPLQLALVARGAGLGLVP